jgi:HK97 family phage major capsid protein
MASKYAALVDPAWKARVVREMRGDQIDTELKRRADELATIRAENGGGIDGLMGEQANRVKVLLGEMDVLSTECAAGGMRHSAPPGGYNGGAASDGVTLAKSRSIVDWQRSKGLIHKDQEGMSLAKFLRGITLADWRGADGERKAMTEGVAGDGGYLVPAPLAGNVIDLVRNKARVMQAGASVVPMTSSTLKIARQTGDPTGVWHAEGASDITPSQLSFDAVTLTAKTLTALVTFSRELLEDATAGGGLEQQVNGSIAAQLALQLDSKSLYGDGTAHAPTGVRNQSGITIQSLGANGATPASYDFLLDAVFGLREVNFQPTAMIDAPRTERTLAGLKDSTQQPLRAPDALAQIPRYSTNQVPVNLTQGTANNASDVFVASWPEVMIGMRTDLQLQVLRERYAESGVIGVLAWMRCDVQLARPDGIVVIEGVKP